MLNGSNNMAHIADYITDAASSTGNNSLISREFSVSPRPQTPLESPPTEEEDKYIWRLQQPSESRKYNIFPAQDTLTSSPGRQSPEGLINIHSVRDRHSIQRPKELSLLRRRKPSVADLGPMTTVQEIAMDSPTIPGRHPVHERSTSSASNRWRQHIFGESRAARAEGLAIDRIAKSSIKPTSPRSPRSLAPLVIPTSTGNSPRRVEASSATCALQSPPPPEVPPKSARLLEQSPYLYRSPFTPATATSVSTAPTSFSNTPCTPVEGRTSPKQLNNTGRSSPKPWMNYRSGRSSPKPSNNSSTTLTQLTEDISTATQAFPAQRKDSAGHFRNQSEYTTQRAPQYTSHRRGESESASSIMERGRPKKPSDGSPIRRIPSKRRTPAEEQIAHEHLPRGVRPGHASSKLTLTEMEALRHQALGQVTRFEVLNSKDVESLSRELRALDERCLYLRKTHRSLRAGRRNLHDRICTYLRSPRTAKFSHDAILKQEEALSELDTSIDDWVSKLDQAENRRTRVRQKLLEHVAAAVFMQPSGSSGDHTPPRSPIKGTSPVRSEASPREEIPIKEEEEIPLMEEKRNNTEEEGEREKERKRKEVESIRIYADSDVFALLADVEEEINRMSEHPSSPEQQLRKSSPKKERPQPISPPSLPTSQCKKSEIDLPIQMNRTPKSPGPKSPFLLRAMTFTMPTKSGVKA